MSTSNRAAGGETPETSAQPRNSRRHSASPQRYYAADARTWAVLQRLRRLDRRAHRALGRTYPFLLGGANDACAGDGAVDTGPWRVHDHYTASGYGDGPLVDPDGDLVLDHHRVHRGGVQRLGGGLSVR